jgi:transposase
MGHDDAADQRARYLIVGAYAVGFHARSGASRGSSCEPRKAQALMAEHLPEFIPGDECIHHQG